MQDIDSKKSILKQLDEFIEDSNEMERLCLREFRRLIENEDYSDAYYFYEGLDTYVRDGIPDDILIFLRAKDKNRKVYKIKFSLVTPKGKVVAKAIGEYHLTEKEKNSPLFASSVYNTAKDWQDGLFKLQVKEITSAKQKS